MTTFPITLPDYLFKSLAEKANSVSVSKNELMEIALRIYLEDLEKEEYKQSYLRVSEDKDIMSIAEDGKVDYFSQLKA